MWHSDLQVELILNQVFPLHYFINHTYCKRNLKVVFSDYIWLRQIGIFSKQIVVDAQLDLISLLAESQTGCDNFLKLILREEEEFSHLVKWNVYWLCIYDNTASAILIDDLNTGKFEEVPPLLLLLFV